MVSPSLPDLLNSSSRVRIFIYRSRGTRDERSSSSLTDELGSFERPLRCFADLAIFRYPDSGSSSGFRVTLLLSSRRISEPFLQPFFTRSNFKPQRFFARSEDRDGARLRVDFLLAAVAFRLTCSGSRFPPVSRFHSSNVPAEIFPATSSSANLRRCA
jgi:hypothetical protein